MAGWTDVVENAILDCYLNQTNITAPVAIYLGLFSVNPTDAGGGTELSGNGYARKDVTTAFSAAASGACTNDAVVQMATASGAWAAVTSVGLFTASSGGTLLAWTTQALDALSANQFHQFGVGEIDFTQD